MERVLIKPALANAWDLFKRNAATFGILFVIMVAANIGLLYATFEALMAMTQVAEAFARGDVNWQAILEFFTQPLFIGAGLGFSLLFFIATLMVLSMLKADKEGKDASFGELLSMSFSKFLPALGLGIVSGLGIMLGLVLLVIPGIALSIYWVFAMYELVVNDRGIMDSLKTSYALIKERWWRTFGLLILLLLLEIVFMIPVGLVGGGVEVALSGDTLNLDGYIGATGALGGMEDMISFFFMLIYGFIFFRYEETAKKTKKKKA